MEPFRLLGSGGFISSQQRCKGLHRVSRWETLGNGDKPLPFFPWPPPQRLQPSDSLRQRCGPQMMMMMMMVGLPELSAAIQKLLYFVRFSDPHPSTPPPPLREIFTSFSCQLLLMFLLQLPPPLHVCALCMGRRGHSTDR